MAVYMDVNTSSSNLHHEMMQDARGFRGMLRLDMYLLM